jgi:hypothetical protein
VAVIGLALAGFIAAQPDHAANGSEILPSSSSTRSVLGPLNTKDRDHLASFWEANGVSRRVQADLFNQLDRGIWPQSSTGELMPIATETFHRNGNIETVQTWPDGSIAVSAAQVTEGKFNPKSFGFNTLEEMNAESAFAVPNNIINCSVMSGSGYKTYKNCAVVGTTATIAEGFMATYTLVQGASDYITSHGGPFQACGGAVCDTPYFAGADLTEGSDGEAYVAYYMRWTGANVSSFTASLNLHVGGDSAITSFRSGL